jgi:hypothetical protein
MNLPEFLERLDRVESHGSYYMARCPGHEDNKRSLSVQQGDKGGIILKCHASCSAESILKAMGLTFSAVMPPKDPVKTKSGRREDLVKMGVTFPGTWGKDRRTVKDAYIYTNQHGEPIYAVLRTDPKGEFPQGRIVEGKFVPGLEGVKRIIYRLPEVLAACQAGEKVYIVEGEKDADGICARGSTGTCNSGGAGKWDPAFAHYFKGCECAVIIRDKDSAGRDHAKKVAASFRPLNIPYRIVEAAEGKDVSDHLDARFSLDELVEADDEPYVILGGKTFRRTFDKEGQIKWEHLANFDARIIREIAVDDGQTNEMFLEITGSIDGNGGPKKFEISAKDFQTLNWVIPKLGAKAIISPGTSKKDHLRTAIQFLSDPEHAMVYAQAGWRTIDGKPMFLTGSGAIGESGLNESIDVDMARVGLGNLAIYPHDDPWDCLTALRDSLKPDVWTPLIGTVFLAPLMAFCDPDFALLIVGESGKFKSEMAAIAQSFFGAFKRTNLVGNMDSTANFIERILHAGKDCAIVVDDFYPSNDRMKAMHLAGVMDRVLRATGNRQARGRMMADTSIRQGYTPKCLPIITAERMPIGQSNSARAYTLELEGDIITSAELTRLQQCAANGMFSGVMFEYLRWICANWTTLREKIPGKYDAIRDRLSAEGHRRAAANSSWVTLGVWAYCEFLSDLGKFAGARDKADIAADTLLTVKTVAKANAERVSDQSLDRVFISMLREGFATGRCHLKGTVEDMPVDCELWGWQRVNEKLVPKGEMVGYVKGHFVHLIPGAAYSFVCQMSRIQDLNFGIDQGTIYRRLAEKGFIAKQEGSGTTTSVLRAYMGSVRVVKMVAHIFQSEEDPDTEPAAQIPAEI